MKLGIIGLPGSGRATIFESLTKKISQTGNKEEDRIGTIRVPDKRIDFLSKMYGPKKTTYAQVEYFLPGGMKQKKEKKEDQNVWIGIKDCDALIHVVRNFGGHEFEKPSPCQDFLKLDQELIFADLIVLEKRLDRLSLEEKRGRKIDREELPLLNECRKTLENDTPLRKRKELALAHLLKGYAFVSAKPMLVLFNNRDDDDSLPEAENPTSREVCLVVRGKLEHEISQMADEEAADFLAEFNIPTSAMDRVIKKSYELLGLISFFTVGEDEVRAWTIKKGMHAVDAAEVIHSDIKKGFIRAEVLAYDDLISAGTYVAARKKGTVRLEGKQYEVQDGDIINFRFNV